MKQHQARKRFGQNFLTDVALIERIINSINPQASDKVVEIGPGLGAITCPLLKLIDKLDVIELDRDIVPKLQLNCGFNDKLVIHNCDVLKFDFNSLAEGDHKLRIIGNLPYNISTPIIFHLVQYADIIRDMHFMLQKEVVQRLAAKPGNKDYGRLSIMAQYHFKITPLFLVPPEAFDPRPKVESAIVKLQPHGIKPVEVADEQLLSSVVSQAFSQRRKTLRNVLKNLCSPEQLVAAGIDPAQRAEQLDLQAFANLCKIIQEH